MTKAERRQRMDEINNICEVLSEREDAAGRQIKYNEEAISKAALKIAVLKTEQAEIWEQLTKLHKEYLELDRANQQAS